MPTIKPRHIVALSGGKDSVAMALYLKTTYPRMQFEYICNVTGNELTEMVAHWRRLEELLGAKIVNVTSDDNLITLCEKMEMLPNWRQRWCTRILKIEPTIAYLEALPQGSKLYVGLRDDEEERKGMYGLDIECVFPLRDAGLGIAEVWAMLEAQGICIPQRTDCALCPYQRLGEWKDLYTNYPDLYWQGVALEIKTGHTFRSPGRDTWPASLLELSLQFDSGRKIREFKNMRSDRCEVCNK